MAMDGQQIDIIRGQNRMVVHHKRRATLTLCYAMICYAMLSSSVVSFDGRQAGNHNLSPRSFAATALLLLITLSSSSSSSSSIVSSINSGTTNVLSYLIFFMQHWWDRSIDQSIMISSSFMFVCFRDDQER